MSEQATLDKIQKFAAKRKSANIIKLMGSKHADTEVLCAGLSALADIADEDSTNELTHYLDHKDPKIRTAACEAALKIGTDYIKTRVRYQLTQEQDPVVKKAVQEAFNKARDLKL